MLSSAKRETVVWQRGPEQPSLGLAGHPAILLFFLSRARPDFQAHWQAPTSQKRSRRSNTSCFPDLMCRAARHTSYLAKQQLFIVSSAQIRRNFGLLESSQVDPLTAQAGPPGYGARCRISGSRPWGMDLKLKSSSFEWNMSRVSIQSGWTDMVVNVKWMELSK